MYNPESPIYIQTDNLRKGVLRLLPHEEELLNRIGTACGIRALNFYLNKVETSKGYKLQHAIIIVEKISDTKQMPGKAAYSTLVSYFHDYFDRYGPSVNDPSKQEIFSRENGVYPETNVGYACMEEIDLQVAYIKASEEIKTIKESVEQEVWNFSTNGEWRTLFYYTDEQLRNNEANGTNDAIRNKLLAILKKYDHYNSFGQHSLKLYFDSKECFDRDYEGKWHYYYK